MFICEIVQDGACIKWVEYSPLLPPLTYADSFAIGGAFMLVMATVWIFNQCSRFISKL